MRVAYLDNAATTPPDPRVLEAMHAAEVEAFGNAASPHGDGLAAARVVERARGVLAEALGATPDEVVLTSGGTEANNLALLGLARAARTHRRHLVVSAIEHSSVLGPAAALERDGWAVTRLPVDGRGLVDPADVAAALRPDTALVSVGHANNEIGTLQPVAAIAAACAERGVPFHTDACQSFRRTGDDAVLAKADLVSVNAHKLHGPKGVGALRVRTGLTLEPLQYGGGHEGGLRAGTVNTAGVVGFGRAVALVPADEPARLAALRDAFLQALEAAVPGLALNGPRHDRLCTNLNVRVPGCSGRELAAELDRRGVRVSRGAACASGSTRPSHVLTAIGCTPEQADSSLRLSLGRFTTPDDLDAALAALTEAVQGLRRRGGA